MTPTAVVIGIGNDFRRDDGVGLAVARRIDERRLPGVRVVTGIGEPTELLDAWSRAPRAVVIDAALGADGEPGRVRRWAAPELPAGPVVSSHALGLAQGYALARALGRAPAELTVFTVDIVDTGQGPGLSSPVAAAIPAVVDAVVAELGR